MMWRWLVVLLVAIVAACESPTGPGSSDGAAVASIELSQNELTLGIGGSVVLLANVRDASGRTLSDKVVFWSSSDETVATVSASGLVTAVDTGTAQIAATVSGRSAVATIIVAPKSVANVQITPPNPTVLVGAQIQLSALTLDAQGELLDNRAVSWTSTNAGVAAVDANGTVTGVAAGLATITANSEGRSASVGVVVSLVPVAAVTVNPTLDTITVGQSTQLSAATFDSIGGALNQREVSWSTSDASVATVSSLGLVIGVAPGAVDITASSEGRTSTARIVVESRPVGAVIVSPNQVALRVGETEQLTVQVTDETGAILTGRPVDFESKNENIATVNSAGLVVARATGTTEIVVTSEGKEGSVTVTVSPVPVASVRVEPATADLMINQTMKLSAVALDQHGNVLSGRVINWASGSPNIATVENDGTVRAVGVGVAIIVATSEGRVGTATINVRGVPVGSVVVSPSADTVIIGDVVTLTYTVRDQNGNIVQGRTAFWTSSNNAVAAVSSDGRVVGISAGVAQISAMVDGVRGQSTITVIPEPVLAVTVQPTSLAMFIGDTARITATPRGRNNIALTGRPVVFTSANPEIATVSSTGLVTALKQGTTQIKAVSEGKEAVVPVTITPVPVASVTVALGSSSLFVGSKTQATATPRDANGNVLTGRVASWRSSNPLVAVVNASGEVTALLPGSAFIVGTVEGISDSATVTVSLVPVATVAVTLDPDALEVGETSLASATLRDLLGNVLTGRPVSWTSSDEAVATITQAGVITAKSAGTTTITAVSEEKSGSATLTVSKIPVATVEVSLQPSSVFVGQPSKASATLRGQGGQVLTDDRTVTWSSSDTDIATINNDGDIVTKAAGTVTITATSEGMQGSANLTVSLVPVASVSVSLTPTSVTAGQTSQATPTLRDADNNILTGRAVSWSSSNETIATVDQNGLVTTLAAGTVDITATSEGVSGSATLTVSNAPVASVTVSLNPSSVTAGQTSQATATLRDADNNILTGRAVSWTSSDENIATVDLNGLVTSKTGGTVEITATSEGVSGSATLTVSNIPVATVSVVLNPPTVTVGQTSQATPTLRDVNENILTGRTVSWTSSNEAIATVDGDGLVTTLAAGTVDITATSEGKSGSATLTVTNVPVATVEVALNPTSVTTGQTSQATATLRDADNNVLTGRAVTWSSSNEAIATVDGDGLVTTLAAGSVDITATSEGVSGFATLTITNVPVATVEVALNPAAVTAGQTSQATATLRDADNNVLTGRTVTWSSSDENIATVDGNGLITSKTGGTVDITATSEGVSGSATLTVSNIPVASVSVVLNPTTVTVGQTSQATPTLRDVNENILTGRAVSWSSSNETIATVDQNGLVTTLAAGTVDITATSEGVSGFATLTITNVPVASVEVALDPAAVTAGQTSQATATLRDADNNVLTGRTVTFSSSNETIATVDQNGLVTTLAAGTVDITATSEGVSGFATLTVTNVPVASVTVALSLDTLELGETGTATATLRDADGNILTGREISWNSSDENIATVDENGAITTLATGTVIITATSEEQSGNHELVIITPQVASVTVTLNPTSVTEGQPSQATAELKDRNGNVLTGRSVAWESSDTNIATIDEDGVITTIQAGSVTITATSEGKSGNATLTVVSADAFAALSNKGPDIKRPSKVAAVVAVK